MTLRALPRVLNTAVAAEGHGRVGPCEHDEARLSAGTGSTNNGKHSRYPCETFVVVAGGDGISGGRDRHRRRSSGDRDPHRCVPVSYTHLRAHETRHDLVCRLLLEKKKKTQ